MFIVESAFWILVTVAVALVWMAAQKKTGSLLLNPVLMSLLTLCALLILVNVPYQSYFARTRLIDALIEPAVVVFGYPLYQQLRMIGRYWWQLSLIASLSVFISLSVATLLAQVFGLEEWVVKSLAVLSTTTPIAMEATEAMGGSASLTSVIVLLGGLSGCGLGLTLLTRVGVRDDRARGLAIGAYSHVMGAFTVAKDSYTAAAFASTSLILCATLTAIIAPKYVPFLLALMN